MDARKLFIKILNDKTQKIEESLNPSSKHKEIEFSKYEMMVNEMKNISSLFEELIEEKLETENEKDEKKSAKKNQQNKRKLGDDNEQGDFDGSSSLFVTSMKDFNQSKTKKNITVQKKKKNFINQDIDSSDPPFDNSRADSVRSNKKKNTISESDIEKGKRLHVSWRISQRNKEKEKNSQFQGTIKKFDF